MIGTYIARSDVQGNYSEDEQSKIINLDEYIAG